MTYIMFYCRHSNLFTPKDLSLSPLHKPDNFIVLLLWCLLPTYRSSKADKKHMEERKLNVYGTSDGNVRKWVSHGWVWCKTITQVFRLLTRENNTHAGDQIFKCHEFTRVLPLTFYHFDRSSPAGFHARQMWAWLMFLALCLPFTLTITLPDPDVPCLALAQRGWLNGTPSLTRRHRQMLMKHT